MSALPDFPQDENALLKLDKAHKALDQVNKAYHDELDLVIDATDQKHSPFIYAAQSVLYEAMGNAAMAGFTREQMIAVMDCPSH